MLSQTPQPLHDPFETLWSKRIRARERTILDLPDGDDPWIYDELHRLIKCSDLAKRYRAEEINKQAWRGGKRRRR